MRKTKLTAAFLTFSLLLAAGAVAGNSNKGKLIILDEPVTVAGKQLSPGNYQLEWVGTGPNVELSISKGRETVAKAPAQLLPLKKAEVGDGYSTDADQAGNKTLTAIFFGGKKYELTIGEASAATATPSDKTPAIN